MTPSQGATDGPLYIRPMIPKGEALLLRGILRDSVTGYAASNPRWKLLEKIERQIADSWPDEAEPAG